MLAIGALLICGQRLGAPDHHHGVMLGAAAGMLFGVSDVAIKALTGLDGVVAILVSPWLRVAIARLGRRLLRLGPRPAGRRGRPGHRRDLDRRQRLLHPRRHPRLRRPDAGRHARHRGPGPRLRAGRRRRARDAAADARGRSERPASPELRRAPAARRRPAQGRPTSARGRSPPGPRGARPAATRRARGAWREKISSRSRSPHATVAGQTGGWTVHGRHAPQQVGQNAGASRHARAHCARPPRESATAARADMRDNVRGAAPVARERRGDRFDGRAIARVVASTATRVRGLAPGEEADRRDRAADARGPTPRARARSRRPSSCPPVRQSSPSSPANAATASREASTVRGAGRRLAEAGQVDRHDLTARARATVRPAATPPCSSRGRERGSAAVPNRCGRGRDGIGAR